MEQNINLAVHQLIKDHILPHHRAIDATCGNGHDTLFLAQNCAVVHAFDIQLQAIEVTQAVLQENNLKNVTLYHQSHDKLVDVIDDDIDIVMYNLGYLPHSDRTITTSPDTTIASLQQALQLLSMHGLIAITIYVGHDGGQEEATAVEEYIKALDKHDYTVVKYEHLNRKNAPYAIFIERIR